MRIILTVIFLIISSCVNAGKIDMEIKPQQGYYIFDKISFIRNKIKYDLFILEKNINKHASAHYDLIVILRYKNNTLINKELFFEYDDNCPADGYGGIYIHNKKIKLKQIFCQDFFFVNSTVTFSPDKNGDLILDSYTEQYTDRSNPNKKIPIKKWTKKQFGLINFIEVKRELFLKLNGLR